MKNIVVMMMLMFGGGGLSGCGFAPVYSQGEMRGELQQVAITAPDNHEAQMLKATLEDDIHAGGTLPAKYNLIPNLQLTITPLSIEANGTTQRYRVVGAANYQLSSVSGVVQTQGIFERFSSYSIARADYSTYVAGKDAKKQVIEAVAEELRLRLIDYFNKQSTLNQGADAPKQADSKQADSKQVDSK